MRYSSSEHIFWISNVIIIALLAALLYYDLTSELDVQKGEKVGVLTFKREKAQRKYEGQVIFENVRQNVDLYNRDTIRTGDDSEAEITLKNDTQIQLEPNSMIILNISDKDFNINYAYGSIRAQSQKEGKDGTTVQIVTSDNKTIAIGDTDLKLTKTEGDKLNLTISRGEANVITDGKKQALKKDQAAVLGEDEIKVQEQHFKLLQPVDNHRFFNTNTIASVIFNWKRLTKKSGLITLELSKYSDFKELVEQKNVRGERASVGLKAGTYYWRLRSGRKDSPQSTLSQVNKFTIHENEPIIFASPRSGSKITFKDDNPLISFTWNSNTYASSYRLEIADNSKFNNPVVRETSINNIALKLDAGNYYYRLSTKSRFPAAEVKSKVGNFSIQKLEKLPPPQLVEPQPDKTINALVLKSRGVIFNWRKNREINRSELWISKDKNFKDKITEISSGNLVTLKEKLDEGVYYWKVRGLDEKNEELTEFSSVSSFQISSAIKLELTSPANQSEVGVISAEAPGISFAWKRPGVPGKYQLRIAQDSNFLKTVFDEKLSSANRNISLNQPGKYYWSVKLLDQDDEILTDSETSSFSITNRLEKPLLIFPQESAEIDMTYQDSIPFRWQEVPGADYYQLKLYQLFGQNRKKLLDERVKDTEYILRKLELLDVGWFSWSITAVNSTRKRPLASQEIGNSFKIKLSNETQIIIKPGEIYFE